MLTAMGQISRAKVFVNFSCFLNIVFGGKALSPLLLLLLVSGLWSMDSKAESQISIEVPIEDPSLKCDWLIGKWQCVEQSTKNQRNLAIESFERGVWRIALFDEDIPDENSDEWGIHRTGQNLRIGDGIKETTDCSSGGELTVTRMFFLNINGRNPYATVRSSFASPATGQLSLIISNTQGNSPGFTETYNCQTVSPN